MSQDHDVPHNLNLSTLAHIGLTSRIVFAIFSVLKTEVKEGLMMNDTPEGLCEGLTLTPLDPALRLLPRRFFASVTAQRKTHNINIIPVRLIDHHMDVPSKFGVDYDVGL